MFAQMPLSIFIVNIFSTVVKQLISWFKTHINFPYCNDPSINKISIKKTSRQYIIQSKSVSVAIEEKGSQEFKQRKPGRAEL